MHTSFLLARRRKGHGEHGGRRAALGFPDFIKRDLEREAARGQRGGRQKKKKKKRRRRERYEAGEVGIYKDARRRSLERERERGRERRRSRREDYFFLGYDIELVVSLVLSLPDFRSLSFVGSFILSYSLCLYFSRAVSPVASPTAPAIERCCSIPRLRSPSLGLCLISSHLVATRYLSLSFSSPVFALLFCWCPLTMAKKRASSSKAKALSPEEREALKEQQVRWACLNLSSRTTNLWLSRLDL